MVLNKNSWLIFWGLFLALSLKTKLLNLLQNPLIQVNIDSVNRWLFEFSTQFYREHLAREWLFPLHQSPVFAVAIVWHVPNVFLPLLILLQYSEVWLHSLPHRPENHAQYVLSQTNLS